MLKLSNKFILGWSKAVKDDSLLVSAKLKRFFETFKKRHLTLSNVE